MSETTLTKDEIEAIRNCEGIGTPRGVALLLSQRQLNALCDAAARAETLEAELAKWNKCDSLVCPYEQRALQAEAQLTEVTRERDEAKRALSVVQNAAKTLVRGADRRVLDATKHEPAARVAIATLDSEREMNAILTQQLEAAQAALASLRVAVGEASIVACDACGRELGSAPTIPPCPECIGFKRAKAHALAADPSAPTPR